MRYIEKQLAAPQDFINAYTPATNYNELYHNQRQAMLQVLLAEQREVCAYCHQTINLQNATIEHLVCQSHNTILQLNYHNLFAVCKGSQGQFTTSHCDKHRSDVCNDYFFPFLLFKHCRTQGHQDCNPFFDVEYNTRIDFISGKLKPAQKRLGPYPAIESRIQTAIETLNLNSPVLVGARRARWDEVVIEQQQTQKTWHQLFYEYNQKIPYTNFHEFVLLAISKKI